MISHFAEHSANERTLLAWIRTAVAINGLGFIVEKLSFYDPANGAPNPPALTTVGYAGEYTGLALVLLGLALIVGATIRFLTLRRLLETCPYQK